MLNIKNNLISFLDEFKMVCRRAGRKPEDVKVLYAIKYLNPKEFVEFIRTAKELKIIPVIVGENRVQSALEKMNYVKGNHFELINDFHPIMIGPLQSNKINKAINIFEEIQSIDTLEIAKDLDSRLKIVNKSMPICLEINVSGEVTKHGFKPEEVGEMIIAMKQYSNLTVKGLMTMAPNTGNIDKIRSVFRKLKEQATKYSLMTSMGMSYDWRIAIEEGSNMVRIGSAIFNH
jgi:pyridoxal phosphate enzyme (YggS family)